MPFGYKHMRILSLNRFSLKSAAVSAFCVKSHKQTTNQSFGNPIRLITIRFQNMFVKNTNGPIACIPPRKYSTRQSFARLSHHAGFHAGLFEFDCVDSLVSTGVQNTESDLGTVLASGHCPTRRGVLQTYFWRIFYCCNSQRFFRHVAGLGVGALPVLR